MNDENETKLIDIIADSLGIFPFKDEERSAFTIRCIYSACRFWIEGFCLDDGVGGSEGIRKQLITRRLSKWITAISDIYPEVDILKWFQLDDHKDEISKIYDRLIMVGDIISENQGATYRCAQAHIIPYAESAYAIIGLCDITSQVIREHTILSGLMVSRQADDLSPTSFDGGKYSVHWWDISDAYRTWTPVSELTKIEYFNPMTTNWKLSDSSSWQPSFPRYSEYALGREHRQYSPEYYVMRVMHNGTYATKITTEEAQSFSLHIRSIAGHPARVIIESLDEQYARLRAPFWQIPPEISRWVDFMTWPERSVEDNSHRIIRQELIAHLIPLLEASGLQVRN